VPCGQSTPSHSANCLGSLVRHPELVAKADRELRAFHLAPLTADDFTRTDLQIIFGALKAALDQDQIEPREFMLEHLDEAVAPRLSLLLNEADEVTIEDPKRIKDILYAVVRLRDRNVDMALNEIRFLQEEAREQVETDLAEMYGKQAFNLTQAKQALSRAKKNYTRRLELANGVGAN